MFALKCALVVLVACVACAAAQAQAPPTTPVPILKQINKQNDDGSYSFGYEAADGSFKIETKYPNGDVAGKYGYVDQEGKTREISYGASSKRGFEPQGAGIVVPPPSLNEPISNALTDGQEDDGQYREDPKIYEDPKYNSVRPGKLRGSTQSFQPQPSFRQFHKAAAPQYQEEQYQEPQYQEPQYQRPQPIPQSQSSGPLYQQQTVLNNQFPQQFPQQQFNQPRPQSQVYHQQPQFSYQAYTPQPQQYQQPQYQQPQYQQPQYQQSQYQAANNYNPFFGHPAQNFDPNTGSYSINYAG